MANKQKSQWTYSKLIAITKNSTSRSRERDKERYILPPRLIVWLCMNHFPLNISIDPRFRSGSKDQKIYSGTVCAGMRREKETRD